MYAEPPGFDRVALRTALQDGWGLDVVSLEYVPVGFGTHHYRVRTGDGGDWFANVDDLADKSWLGPVVERRYDALDRAFRTAHALRDLDFVHAPVPRSDGSCLAPLAGNHTVSVVEYLDGTGHPFGPFPTDEMRREVIAAVRRLHATTVPDGLPNRQHTEIAHRTELFGAERPWRGGPYSERAERVVFGAEDRLTEWFARFDELRAHAESTVDSWVVTHGEPHAGNVMRTRRGIRLIDWDTVALGPRERDLWQLQPTDGDPRINEFYQWLWDLSEICGFAEWFRKPHTDDENTRIAWRALEHQLRPGRSVGDG